MKPSREPESFRLDLPSVASGIFYGFTMFVAGFIMGELRVLYLEPWFGERNSLLMEVPIMLPICWYLSWQSLMCWYLLNIVLAWGGKAGRKKYTNVDTMGVTAFLTLLLLEFVLAMTIFHKSFHETIFEFEKAGTAAMAVQLLASAFPIIQEELHERWMQ